METKDRLYSDLLDACARPGCPLCQVATAFVRRYLDGTMYEHVNDPGVRAALRNARGYCNTHAWMLTNERGVVLGTAIIQRDILETALKALEIPPRGRKARQYAKGILRHLRPTAECPACIYRQTTEDLALQTLLKYLDDPQLMTALGDTSGLCLPHLERALELVEDDNQLRRLLQIERRALRELHHELSELISKHDYRFANEGIGDEGDSWLRATGIVSAERNAR